MEDMAVEQKDVRGASDGVSKIRLRTRGRIKYSCDAARCKQLVWFSEPNQRFKDDTLQFKTKSINCFWGIGEEEDFEQ